MILNANDFINYRCNNCIFRFCWSVILFSLLILGVFLSIMLWNKFYSLPTIVSIENHVPVTNVAFPGVTLCSPLAILEYKLDAFMERM